jgi:hypothetical protein
VPLLLGRPKLANQSGPRRSMVGTHATVSTLVTAQQRQAHGNTAKPGGLLIMLAVSRQVDHSLTSFLTASSWIQPAVAGQHQMICSDRWLRQCQAVCSMLCWAAAASQSSRCGAACTGMALTCGWAAVQPHRCRVGRLQPGLALQPAAAQHTPDATRGKVAIRQVCICMLIA